MTIDQRLPALHALRDELHDKVQFARHKAECAAQEGRADVNGLMQHWQILQSQLNELDYAIECADKRTHDNRIEITPHLLIVAIIVFALAMTPIISALLGGH